MLTNLEKKCFTVVDYVRSVLYSVYDDFRQNVFSPTISPLIRPISPVISEAKCKPEAYGN